MKKSHWLTLLTAAALGPGVATTTHAQLAADLEAGAAFKGRYNDIRLPGGGGRAEDVFAGFTSSLSDKVTLKAGYRVFEGGVNISDVYSYTWVNYASAGVLFTC